jgi:hypothetical protein
MHGKKLSEILRWIEKRGKQSMNAKKKGPFMDSISLIIANRD